jgi:hypothetical protein
VDLTPLGSRPVEFALKSLTSRTKYAVEKPAQLNTDSPFAEKHGLRLKWVFPLTMAGMVVLMAGCVSPEETPYAAGQDLPSTPNELDAAQRTLVSFFDDLARGRYRQASEHFVVPNALTFLYDDIDPQDGEVLLARACGDRAGCKFFCWRIKDVIDRVQASPTTFYFTVRFEDEEGNLLIGGDNVTPRVWDPPGCTEFKYAVVKVEDQFYVDGIPVFTGCWP